MMRRWLWADAATALVLGVAALVLIVPVREQGRANALALPPEPAVSAVANEASARPADAMTVVDANILSGSRRAPLVRYISPDSPAAMSQSVFRPVPTMEATAGGAIDSTGAVSGDAVPQLYGIVSVGGQRLALVRLTQRDAAPLLLSEGDQRSGFRLLRIEADRIVLTGAAGQRTLRLSRNAPGDSTGKNL